MLNWDFTWEITMKREKWLDIVKTWMLQNTYIKQQTLWRVVTRGVCWRFFERCLAYPLRPLFTDLMYKVDFRVVGRLQTAPPSDLPTFLKSSTAVRNCHDKLLHHRSWQHYSAQAVSHYHDKELFHHLTCPRFDESQAVRSVSMSWQTVSPYDLAKLLKSQRWLGIVITNNCFTIWLG